MNSGQFVNIPKSKEDPAYRYKRPVLLTKIEGSGNGIKTNLVNLVEVAEYLRCPEDCKFLGQIEEFDQKIGDKIVKRM